MLTFGGIWVRGIFGTIFATFFLSLKLIRNEKLKINKMLSELKDLNLAVVRIGGGDPCPAKSLLPSLREKEFG